MTDIGIDIVQRRPLRLGVAMRDQVRWDQDGTSERIHGTDLRDVTRQSTRLRHDQPEADIVIEIDVIVANEARAALAMLDADTSETTANSMLYVGTPSGLAGLIADIQALGIADGAVLIPRTPGMAQLIRDAVLPMLHSKLQLPAA